MSLFIASVAIYPFTSINADIGENEAAIVKRYGQDTFPDQHLYKSNGITILVIFAKGASVNETFTGVSEANISVILARYSKGQKWVLQPSDNHFKIWKLPGKGITASFLAPGSLTISLDSYEASQPKF